MNELKDNKETLLSFLEPFLHDPIVAWVGRTGRQEQMQHVAQAGHTVDAEDYENINAKDALRE